MLSANRLNKFLKDAQENIPLIQETIALISDGDVAEFTRDIKVSDNKVVLIGVLPSFNLNFTNEDNYKHRNRLMLFVVKKHDSRSGNDEFLKVYDDTGAAVLALEEYLFELHQDFCSIFKRVDFRSFTADPVRDYHGFNGYMVQFDLDN